MDVKQLNGKTIKTVENQENGYSVITFTDGTTAVILVAFITAASIAAPAAPAKKEEVKAPAKKEEVKKAAPAKKDEDEDEDEDEEITWDDLVEMDEEELVELIDAEDLDVDADDYEDDEDGLRKAIAEEMEIEIPKKKKK